MTAEPVSISESTARGVGFVGLGNIGRPMAKRLLDEPGGLRVHDLDAAAVSRLVARGAAAAASPRELAERARCVSVMVRDDPQVRHVVTGPDGLLTGARAGDVIAIHSTIHPDTARELALHADEQGVHLLDAPVSGGPMGAAEGTLAIMVGGSDEAFAAALPVLERMGSMVVHAGPVGAGTAMKLARNLLHFVAFTAAGEALAVADAAGLDLAALGEIVRHTDAITGGPGSIMYRAAIGPVAPEDAWHPILTRVRDLGEKDLALAAELAASLGVAVPLTELARDRLAAGLGVAHEAVTR